MREKWLPVERSVEGGSVLEENKDSLGRKIMDIFYEKRLRV